MELHHSMKITPEQSVIALTGGGGKTTSLYGLSRESAASGRKTVLMTTTHIGVPRVGDVDFYAEADEEKLRHTWAAGRIAAVGTVGGDGRLTAPDEKTYDLISRQADAIYIEADGSRCLPLKYPADHEPVIPANVDRVLVLCGLSALDQPFDEACHRAALARAKTGIKMEVIDEETIARILCAGYGKYDPVIILNQADTAEMKSRGERVAALMLRDGIRDVSVLSLHQLLGLEKG